MDNCGVIFKIIVHITPMIRWCGLGCRRSAGERARRRVPRLLRLRPSAALGAPRASRRRVPPAHAARAPCSASSVIAATSIQGGDRRSKRSVSRRTRRHAGHHQPRPGPADSRAAGARRSRRRWRPRTWGCGGHEAAQAQRARNAEAHARRDAICRPPVAMMTGTRERQDVKLAYEHGANAVLGNSGGDRDLVAAPRSTLEVWARFNVPPAA